MPSPRLWTLFLAVTVGIIAANSPWTLITHVTSVKQSAFLIFAFLCGAIFLPVIRLAFTICIRADTRDSTKQNSVYGLDHGRLHLKRPNAMWMNMGYWKDRPIDLAEACRNLLIEVMDVTAGCSGKIASSEIQRGAKQPTCVIDLGFGCGDQTACLMGTKRPGEQLADDAFGFIFEHYVGLTLDKRQYQYAKEKIMPSSVRFSEYRKTVPIVHLFCEDAAKPDMWGDELKACIQDTLDKTQVRWVLALDTAYHFSPSRWPVINYACRTLHASFAAFDLCLSPTATFWQKLVLRILTSLMGVPWANLVTPDDYRARLIEAGYDASGITIRDISTDVFGPLAGFIEQQDRDLSAIGLGIGSFNVARMMFGWWARSGVVRGVIVVAKQPA